MGHRRCQLQFAEGPGTHSPDTRVYVSFGFGLKKCLEDETITFNPRGSVTGPQERKPRGPNEQPQYARIHSRDKTYVELTQQVREEYEDQQNPSGSKESCCTRQAQSEGVPGWFRCCMLGPRPPATKMKVLQSYFACFKCILHLS